MRTSISVPDTLISEIKKFNKDNPERQIGISGTCKKALEIALKKAKSN